MTTSVLSRFVFAFMFFFSSGIIQAQPTALPSEATDGSAATSVTLHDGRCQPGRPIVIAHRGSSGHRPEHTLGGYTLAMQQGADQIEPDLVLTSDGVLVVMHDLTLNNSTDIAQHAEFADRAHEHAHGKSWYVYDFTLEELRTLRCEQPYRCRSREFDGQETIPTFAESVALVRAYNEEFDTQVGLCPELKGPAAHSRVGLDIVVAFLEAVDTLGLEDDEAMPVIVQCFEIGALEKLRPETELSLLLLMSGMPREASWARITAAADYIGITKGAVLGEDGPAHVETIHGHGLGVIAWTFRDDSVSEGYADSAAEIREAIDNGIDGYFTDFPDTGVGVRAKWLEAREAASSRSTPAVQD